MAILLNEEGASHVTSIGVLEGMLPRATEYFAVSPTSAREWFDPAAQVYLGRVVAEKMKRPQLVHKMRVLLFLTAGALKDVHAIYLDGYHAKSLLAWHVNFNVPVAYLRPNEIVEILKGLSPAEQKTIGYGRGGLIVFGFGACGEITIWLSLWFPKRVPRDWYASRSRDMSWTFPIPPIPHG